LQSWIKFCEGITKPLPVASSLFLIVSTWFLLAASDSTLAKLGLSHIVADYRWVVGLGFVIASTWLVVTALVWQVPDHAWEVFVEHKEEFPNTWKSGEPYPYSPSWLSR
jgi:hypothetical protein